MSDQLDPQMDRFLKAVGSAWCEAVASPQSRFLDEFQARLRKEKTAEAAPRARVQTVEPARRRSWLPYAIAACLVIGLGLGMFALRFHGGVGNIYYQRGQIAETDSVKIVKGTNLVCDEQCAGIVALDGGRVVLFLNSDTQLQVARADQVRLEEGEVWAVVRPNSGFFQVATPYGTVDVHGTTFGVSVDAAGATVSLLSGAVEVSSPASQATLGPNQQAHLPAQAGLPITVTTGGVATPQWVIDLETEAAQENASKYFPSGAPRNEPHGGLLPCATNQQASL